MIFTVPMKPINVDGELQFSYSINTKKGQIIKREDWLEQPNLNNVEYYPSNDKIAKSLNNYIMLKGKIKITYTWEEADNITEADVTEFKNLCAEFNPEDSYANWENGENSLFCTLEYPACINEWTERSLAWELKSKTASLEILEDGTEILCVLQDTFGWEFKNVDLKAQESIETNKNSNLCYLFFGDKCEISVPSSNLEEEAFIYNAKQYEVKQLTSSKCFIKNTSDNPCKIVMLCKS
jgi:hypothetical protein